MEFKKCTYGPHEDEQNKANKSCHLKQNITNGQWVAKHIIYKHSLLGDYWSFGDYSVDIYIIIVQSIKQILICQ